MTRLDISTGIAFDDFRAALETAAPAPDGMAILQILADKGDWNQIRAQAEANAPHGLMTYATLDAGFLFAVAGHRTKAVEYLLGNHVIAETMFHHDPRAMLYAPLRVLVYSDADDNAVFCIDQPSRVFAGFGNPAITSTGTKLDHIVVALLRAIGVDARDIFTTAQQPPPPHRRRHPSRPPEPNSDCPGGLIQMP